MAGAKETPRQKLISLMYLVFITMLALNVSKEVLAGFGQMFYKIKDANSRLAETNEILYEKVKTNAEEKEGKWLGHNRTAQRIKEESDKLYNLVGNIKNEITEKQREKDPELIKFQEMDKGDQLNSVFFGPDGVSERGVEFVNQINDYKMQVIQVFGSQYPKSIEVVEARFFTGDQNSNVKNKDNADQAWLAWNYEGFPLVSSLAKLTMLQNDIRQTETDVLTTLMGKEMELETGVNESNYITLLKTEKGAYYSGETFDGSVILGRKGGAQNPNNVKISLDGKELTDKQYELIPGGIKLKVDAGRPGDHTLSGDLVFLNDGEESKITVNQIFTTISKPNSAVISADKMNVVYRGVDNPITISIPGIIDSKVRASAPGLKRLRGSKYMLSPQKGREVKINVSGTLPDGKRVSSVSKFRIKEIPEPSGFFRGSKGAFSLPKSSLAKGKVEARLVDFDFDLPVNVTSFRFRAPGAPSMVIEGNRLNAKAISSLRRIKKGQTVQITDIKTKITGSKYRLQNPSPVFITIN